MLISRDNTHDLQKLVHCLQIDPENVGVETPNWTEDDDDDEEKEDVITIKSPKTKSEVKALPVRAAKRRASQDPPGGLPLKEARSKELYIIIKQPKFEKLLRSEIMILI